MAAPPTAAAPTTDRAPALSTVTVAEPVFGRMMVPNARSEVLLAVSGARTVAVPVAVAEAVVWALAVEARVAMLVRALRPRAILRAVFMISIRCYGRAGLDRCDWWLETQLHDGPRSARTVSAPRP